MIKRDAGVGRSVCPRSSRIMLIGLCTLVLGSLVGRPVSAAELNFNVTLRGGNDPIAGSGLYSDVWAEGDYAYLGSYQTTGVRIFDISDPTDPTLVATYAGGNFKDVKTRNSVGYFATDDDNGMHIVDLSDPTQPTLIKQVTSLHGGFNDIHNISVDGDYLYQADNHNPVVKVINISDPANPFFVRNIVLNTPGEAVHDITAMNGRLYTSSKSSSTTSGGTTNIYDVTNIGAQAPPLLKQFTSGPRTHSNWPSADHNLLVVAQERSNGEIRVYDISDIDEPNDPDSPVLLKSITRDTLNINAISPHNPVIAGDKLYVSWYHAGLMIFDLSDPSSAPLIGAYDTLPGTVGQPNSYAGNWGVFPFLAADRVLLSDTENGLIVVDASAAYGSAPLAGDFNADGFVGVADLNLVLSKWNRAVTPGDEWQGDTDNDGYVGIGDLNAILGNWNAGSPPLALPEPGAVVFWMAVSLRCAGRGGTSGEDRLISCLTVEQLE